MPSKYSVHRREWYDVLRMIECEGTHCGLRIVLQSTYQIPLAENEGGKPVVTRRTTRGDGETSSKLLMQHGELEAVESEGLEAWKPWKFLAKEQQ